MAKLLKFDRVYVNNFASVVGKREAEGPLSRFFDEREEDEYFGKASWEQAESEMVRRCIKRLLEKSKTNEDCVEFACGGDLLNQCVGSTFGVKEYGIPYFGLYGACSTFAESVILGSSLISAGFFKNTVALADSHFCSAEKQYRFPLEYGGQRTPTTQYTVTGCGSMLLDSEKSKIQVCDGLVGRIIDRGITDVNNMGAAMAPAAIDTVKRYFEFSKNKPSDFDIIATGDLGREGYELVCEELCSIDGFCDKYTDCGMLIFDYEKQDIHAGGSGCGCSAVVTCGFLLDKLKSGEASRILLIGTGALMNPNTVLQGQTIAGIAHAVSFSRSDK